MLTFCTPTRWVAALAMYLGVLFPGAAQDFPERDKAVTEPPSGKGLGTASVGGVPVNLFTGAASPAYPLYELPGRGLSIPISLNYVAGGGVQVASVASEVGTGWVLNAGGSVSCEVKGRPDEFDTEPKTWLLTVAPHTGGTELARRFCEGKDTEYDIYHLAALGLQADFVIDGPTGSPAQATVYVLNDRTLRVEPRYWTNSRKIFSFLVTDATGTQYTFGQAVNTRMQTETKQLRTGNLSSKDDYTYVSQWHLTKVRSATGDEITFYYDGAGGNPVRYRSSAHVTLAYRNCNAQGQNCETVYTRENTGDNNRYETTTTVSPSVNYQISSIYSAAGEVRFYRGQHLRRDAPGGKALDKVAVFDRERNLIKSFVFSYDYFGAGQNAAEDMRLKLTRITAKNNGCQATSTDLLYREYGGTVSRLAAQRDAWGYFNDNASTELMPFVEARYPSGNRDASLGATAQNCILYRIQSGTGAYTELTYGRHVDAAGAIIGGVRLEQVRVHDGVSAAQDQLFQVNYNTFLPASGTFASTSSAPPVPLPQLYEWQQFRYSAVAPGVQFPRVLDVCDSNDDLIYKYLYRGSEPLAPLATDYIHYRWVTVQHSNRSKTAYQFTTATDYPDTYDLRSTKITADPYNPALLGCNSTSGGRPSKDAGSCNGDPLAPHRAGDYISLPHDQRPYGVLNSAAAKRGLVRQQVEVDAEGRLVSQVDNVYDFSQTKLTPFQSVVVAKEQQVFGYYGYSYYYNAKVYQHERNWVPLIRQTLVRYDQRRGNPGPIASQTRSLWYEYKNALLWKTRTFAPGSDTRVVEYKRAGDGAGPEALRNAKSYATIVEAEAYRLNSSGAKAGSFYTYHEYENNATNLVRLVRTGTWDASSGVNQWQYKVQAVEFDEHSSVVNAQGVNGLWAGTLRGYHQLLPIASVVNAKFGTSNSSGTPATAGHTSFEEANGDPDHWSTGATYVPEAKTGQRSVQLSATGTVYGPGRFFVLKPEDQHGKYVFSCWAKVPKDEAGGSRINLATFVSVPSGDNTWRATGSDHYAGQDWQWCRAVLDLDDPAIRKTLPANQNITLNCYPYVAYGQGNVLIDEVRFHPEGARMTTATYLPLVGKTSETDENGVTTYYEYDAENQPLLVRDAKRNILKRTKTSSPALSQELVASVTQTGGNTYPGTVATFTAAAPDCGSVAITYSWNFGDGGTAKGAGVQNHTYARAGTYQLTVVAESPGVDPVEKTLSVPVVAPLTLDDYPNGSTYFDECDPYGAEYGGSGQRDVGITVVPGGGCAGYTYYWETSEFTAWNNAWGPWTAAGTTDTIRYYHSGPRRLGVRCTVTDACGNTTVYQAEFYTYQSSPSCPVGPMY